MTDCSSTGSSTSLRRKPSYRALGSLPPKPSGSPTVWFFCSPPAQEEEVVVAAEERSGGRHFLDACVLCQLALRRDRDVYMCRGNVAFCSEECRQEWMDNDEEREEGERAYYYRSASAMAAAAAASASEGQQGRKATPRSSRVFHVRATEAVVAS